MTSHVERRAAERGHNTLWQRPASPQPQPSTAAAPSTELHAPDYGYLTALGLLVSAGLVLMYSASAVTMTPGDYLKMGIGLVGGLICLWFASRLTPRQLRRGTLPFLVLCVAALAVLFVAQNVWPSAPFVVTVNGGTRWIGRPGILTLQPSEYAKLAFVLFAAHYLDKNGHKMARGGSRPWITFLGVLGLLAGLIYKEPDLGTALVIAGTALCMLVVAGVSLRKLIAGALMAAMFIGVMAWNTSHQRERLRSWWNPWATEYRQEGGYQVVQSLSAMANGGVAGVGLGKSINKLQDRLPESETDFVFAIVAEELGLVRAALLILLFGLFIWAGYGIAGRAPDRYTALLVSGITSWVAVQTCLNLAVVTGTVPNTGVPLPFVSSGLSSLTALLAGTGIVTAISRRTVQGGKPVGR